MSEAQWESETIINFNEDEVASSIYTASRRVAALLERRGLKPVGVDRLAGSEPCGWWFEVPKWQVLIKPGKKTVRIGGRKSGASAPDRIDSTLQISTQNAQISNQ